MEQGSEQGSESDSDSEEPVEMKMKTSRADSIVKKPLIEEIPLPENKASKDNKTIA